MRLRVLRGKAFEFQPHAKRSRGSEATCATLLTFTLNPMKLISAALLSSAIFLCGSPAPSVGNAAAPPASAPSIFGFRDAAAEQATESRFLAVPDSKLAQEHLRILTRAPHMAGTIEDKATADYVAQKFRDASHHPRGQNR